MESTIILKSDALNALRAAHRLMREMSDQSQSSVESYHFERGFSAALSTIATVFGLELAVGPDAPVADAGWHIANERALSILEAQSEALDWSDIPSSRPPFGTTGGR